MYRKNIMLIYLLDIYWRDWTSAHIYIYIYVYEHPNNYIFAACINSNLILYWIACFNLIFCNLKKKHYLK